MTLTQQLALRVKLVPQFTQMGGGTFRQRLEKIWLPFLENEDSQNLYKCRISLFPRSVRYERTKEFSNTVLESESCSSWLPLLYHQPRRSQSSLPQNHSSLLWSLVSLSVHSVTCAQPRSKNTNGKFQKKNFTNFTLCTDLNSMWNLVLPYSVQPGMWTIPSSSTFTLCMRIFPAC